ncbi:hypothetical protein FBU31_007356, partial [Coemansia sp. 'formosensis']
QSIEGAPQFQQQQPQQQQQRMFTGTNIPMPQDYLADLERNMTVARAQMGATGTVADFSAMQQAMEHHLLNRYMSAQQGRPPMAGSSEPLIAPQQQQQQQQQALQPAAMRPSGPMTTAPAQAYAPAASAAANPTAAAAAAAAAASANYTHHMALVGMLTKQYVQILYNQLRTQLPQMFSNIAPETFNQLLLSGQLANIQPVNHLLVIIIQQQQQQQQQQRFQQQQQQQMTPPRPPLASAPAQGMMTPQMQMQLQNYQRAQMYQQQAVRPPNQIMSPPPPPQSMTPALVAGTLPQSMTPVANRATPTPAAQQQQQQRGVKRKSANNSPAQAPGVLPTVNKSPRITSPSAGGTKHQPPPAATQSPAVSAPAAPRHEPDAFRTSDAADNDAASAKPAASGAPVLTTSTISAVS